ncbi:MAG: hypothetical protein WAN28_21040, partial [Terracidiphilus sp.]
IEGLLAEAQQAEAQPSLTQCPGAQRRSARRGCKAVSPTNTSTPILSLVFIPTGEYGPQERTCT